MKNIEYMLKAHKWDEEKMKIPFIELYNPINLLCLLVKYFTNLRFY